MKGTSGGETSDHVYFVKERNETVLACTIPWTSVAGTNLHVNVMQSNEAAVRNGSNRSASPRSALHDVVNNKTAEIGGRGLRCDFPGRRIVPCAGVQTVPDTKLQWVKQTRLRLSVIGFASNFYSAPISRPLQAVCSFTASTAVASFP